MKLLYLRWMALFSVVSFLFVVLPVLAPASAQDAEQPDGAAVATQSGLASMYDDRLEGRRTASGERYARRELTAAHRTLPFGTLVHVVNRENGRSVVVRVNDRGPFVAGRIIDLSDAAARALDMRDDGLVGVDLFPVDTPAYVAEQPRQRGGRTEGTATTGFAVQLGSFQDRRAAVRMAGSLRGAWVQQTDVQGRALYRVYFGTFEGPDEARAAQQRLRSLGHEGFVKQIDPGTRIFDVGR